MIPNVALARFLRGLGVSTERVPFDLDEATALYQAMLAGRQVLVLLDNAGHVDQVRPLLAAADGCRTLITSRDSLTGLIAFDGAPTGWNSAY